MACLCLQRNHTLFGSVVSTLTGVRPILPFLNRTQSLHGKSDKVYNPVTTITPATAKLLQGQAVNGGIGACNHMVGSDRGIHNHTPRPSPRASVAIMQTEDPQQPAGDRWVDVCVCEREREREMNDTQHVCISGCRRERGGGGCKRVCIYVYEHGRERVREQKRGGGVCVCGRRGE